MKRLSLIFLTIGTMSSAFAESSLCSSDISTTVQVQMVREDGTIQTPKGEILSKDYSDVIETRPENILEKSFYCGDYSRNTVRTMMDALAAKYDLGARKGKIYLNKISVFASQGYSNGLVTLNASNIATINRTIKNNDPK